MYLDLRKPNNNGFIFENSAREMIRTHSEVRMANDGLRMDMVIKWIFENCSG